MSIFDSDTAFIVTWSMHNFSHLCQEKCFSYLIGSKGPWRLIITLRVLLCHESGGRILYANWVCWQNVQFAAWNTVIIAPRHPRPIAQQRKILALNIKYLSEQCGICITVEHETGSAVHFISRIYERRRYRRVLRSWRIWSSWDHKNVESCSERNICSLRGEI